MGSLRELTVSCSCGSATHTFEIPVSELPLASQFCSCDTSRRISGSLLTSYINITHSKSAPKPDLSALTPYHSSDRLIRHFCSTCGTHMYLEYHIDGHFEAATGTLQADSTQEVVEYQSCMWIEDTKDGGASDWLTSIDGKVLKKWTQEAGESDEILLDHYSTSPNRLESAQKPIRAHCHCNGVAFWIQPPNAASKTARSDFPDLLIPYHLGRNASANPSNDPWWLHDHGTKFLAGTCTCNSCRRASGFYITFWAFVPTANIFLDSDLTRPFPSYDSGHSNEYWGSIKTHRSSDGVTRAFCRRCGANIFWDGGAEKGRDGLIDVAAGLLDAESGARAEELLSWWTDRVSFAEFAVNKSLAEALGVGLQDWETRKGGKGAAVIDSRH
ncbi:hypothetical protein BU25DRAFT_343524 [Macroventuria anomochaeta]|uniref:Uncharacterized protein n=1 Tax=Macroventuria anomochaeta TaxID=301207 RepID=A0ACB6RXC8_9PLEO|nr:uncharacterized protein BU25DRAFT_343524 [Macroventuria anomochaeta]KAF2626691.1 hypothetical protein BU25DRAFT_343524 [Macroventuria anomochaeta]